MVSLVFVLFAVVFALILLAVFGSLIFHFFTTGSLFYVIQQHLRRQVEQSSPKPCAFCGSTIPAGETNCPGCGGPLDGTRPGG